MSLFLSALAIYVFVLGLREFYRKCGRVVLWVRDWFLARRYP